MISCNSNDSIYQASAASEGAQGVARNFPITLRPMLANSRKEHSVLTDEIVIG